MQLPSNARTISISRCRNGRRIAVPFPLCFRCQEQLPISPEADSHFGASVFWTKRSGAIGGEQAMIEYWQARREGGRRGIIEIVREGS